MSVAISNSTPPPAQSPLTAATIGLENVEVFSSERLTMRAVSSLTERSPPISAPAQKPFSPAPVITTQRQSTVLSSRSHSAASSPNMARDMALRLAWLSIVTSVMWRETSRTSSGIRGLLRFVDQS